MFIRDIMLFNSFDFFVFFPVVTILYFVLPHKLRWFLLLAASCYFYMAFIPVYILILFATIVVDYGAGLFIEKSQGRSRKIFLIVSIISNVGFLAFFKYFNFAAANLNHLSNFLHWNYSLPLLSILLPIGLSFHTFQAMSYTIEVYRGNQKAERHFGIYALYVMFYPQLVAGPIERPQNLIHQFYEKHYFECERVINGLKLILWGLFKKVVIADRAATLVDAVYNDPSRFYGLPLIIATILFAFQIYCDFSGYSDIAIGAAEVMGFRLMKNFNRPYAAISVSDFWKRWHISLSSWLKDYIYIPLGGNRVSKYRRYFNLFFVFLVSGIWHGANWTFIFWGILHGCYQIISIITKNFREKLSKLVGLSAFPALRKLWQTAATFSLVCFTWIFFRADNFSEALFVVHHLFDGWTGWLMNFNNSNFLDHSIFLEQSRSRLLLIVAAIIVMEVVQVWREKENIKQVQPIKNVCLRWGLYVALLWLIIIFGKFGERQFIYFVF